MSTTTSITTETARTTTRRTAKADRKSAEAVIAAPVNAKLQRALDAVAAAGERYRAAEAAHKAAYQRLVELCGSDEARKEIEDRARRSVPIPEELKGVRRPGPFISRMLVEHSDGEKGRDVTYTEPPLIDWNSGLDIAALNADPALKRKVKKHLNAWLQAKNDAWDSLYNDEQKAANVAMATAKRNHSRAIGALEHAAAKLMQVRARSPQEIEAKFRAWSDAWGLVSSTGKLDVGQMDEWDKDDVLASIGADLLAMNGAGQQAAPPVVQAPEGPTIAELVANCRAVIDEINRTPETDGDEQEVDAKLDAVYRPVLEAQPRDLADLVALIDFFKQEHDDDPDALSSYFGKRPIEHLHARAQALMGCLTDWTSITAVRPNDADLADLISRATAQGHRPEEVAQVVYSSPTIPGFAPAIYFEKPNGDLVIVSRSGTQTSCGGPRHGYEPDRDHWKGLLQRLREVRQIEADLNRRTDVPEEEFKAWEEADKAILAEIEATPALNWIGLQVKAEACAGCGGVDEPLEELSLSGPGDATTDIRLAEQVIRGLVAGSKL